MGSPSSSPLAARTRLTRGWHCQNKHSAAAGLADSPLTMGAGCSGGDSALLPDDRFSPSKLKKVEQLFRTYDTDNDNEIDATELMAVMRSLGHNPTPTDIEHMIRSADGSHVVDEHCTATGSCTGTVNLSEFIDLMSRESEATDLESEVREAFAMQDTDADGYISTQALMRFLSKNFYGRVLDQNTSCALHADSDGDGRISADEFVAVVMRRTMPKRTNSEIESIGQTPPGSDVPAS